MVGGGGVGGMGEAVGDNQRNGARGDGDGGGGGGGVGEERGGRAERAERATERERPAEHAVTLHVPPPSVGFIIGKKGETIQRVQSTSGAHVDVDKDDTTLTLTEEGEGGGATKLMRRVRITGRTAEAVQNKP